MNRKQLIILLAALVILGGAGLVIRNHHEESWSTSDSELGQKVLPNFPVNDVAALHIKDTADLNVVKKNDRWVVQERNNYPANFEQIKELLLKMEDLKIAQAEPIGSSQLARVHLQPPGSGPDGATLIEFKDAQGKVLQSLLLGKKHVRENSHPSPMSFGENADGRFVMRPGDAKEVLTVSDPLNSVNAKATDWLNKDFFKVEKVKSISFVSTTPSNSWSLSRESETSPWVLADAKPGEVLDTNKVSSLGSALGYANYVDVAADNSPAKTGMDKPQVVTVTTFDHFTYIFKIGAKTPDNFYNLDIAVTADFPTERLVGKDEKPEGKKALDKEFQDKLKPLQDKLAKEKSLEHATYLVNTWLMDPVMRDRAKLMVEKKDGSKKGETKDAGAASGAKPEAGLPFPPIDPNDQPSQ